MLATIKLNVSLDIPSSGWMQAELSLAQVGGSQPLGGPVSYGDATSLAPPHTDTGMARLMRRDRASNMIC